MGSDYTSTNAAIMAGTYGLDLFANWQYMSPYQKALSMAHMGINTANLGSGNYDNGGFYGTKIPGTENGTQALTIGNGLQLAGNGLNLYNTVSNWNSMDTLSRALYGGQTVQNAASTYDMVNKYLGSTSPGISGSTGMTALGAGVSGLDLINTMNNWQKYNGIQKVQAGLTAGTDAYSLYTSGSKLLSQGATQAGSQAAAQGTAQVGTQATAQGTAQVGTEAGTQAAAQGGTEAGAEAGSSMGTYAIPGAQVAAGALGVVQGTKGAIDNWGTGGEKGRQNGAINGAMAGVGAGMMGSGLAVMTGLAALGPAGWIAGGVLFAASMLGGSIKLGKSTAQTERDGVRSFLKDQVGLTDDQYNITLSNGSKQSIGIDGHGDYRTAKDPSKLTPDSGVGGGKLQAFDTDYTNGLDYFAGTAGTALSRMMAGGASSGKDASVDQVGGQIGNAILKGTVGFGQDMTQDNFNTVKTELLGQYSKAGIKTKDDLYTLVNEMAKNGTIDKTQQVSMQQIGNMMYDKDGFNTMQKLYASSYPGIQAASAQAADAAKQQPQVAAAPAQAAPVTQVAKPANVPATKAQAQAQNAQQFQRSPAPQEARA